MGGGGLADTPGRMHPLGRHPPEKATAAHGKHPTGMHSCWSEVTDQGQIGCDLALFPFDEI